MDENFSWKIIYIAAIFSLVILAVAYYFIAPSESPFFTEERTKRIAEFKNTRVVGRNEGRKIWEFFAEDGWTTTDREITHLREVSQGRLYKDGRMIVSDLTAPRAKAFRHSEIVETFGSPVEANIDLGRLSRDGQSDWTRLETEYLKYIPKDNRSVMQRNVTLYKKDSSISSQSISVDHDKSVADISQDIRLKRRDGLLTSTSMRYFSREEKLLANGDVDFQIKEGELETRIKADRASFYTDIGRNMTVKGNLEAVQGKKLAIADSGLYSQKRKELLLEGSVRAVFEKAGVIFKQNTVDKLKNAEAQGVLREKTVLTSDRLVLATGSGNARASGAVFVTQKGREAKADRADYDEAKEILTLTGNVYVKMGEEWVSAEKVIVSVKDETFEAEGAVEADLKI